LEEVFDLSQITYLILLKEFTLVFTFEQVPAREKSKHQGATTEDVTFCVIALIPKYFWSHIARCAAFVTELRIFDVFGQIDSESEICNFDIELFFFDAIDQYVVQLHISVNYPLLVHKVNTEQELLHYYLDLFLLELIVLEDLAKEGTLLLILKDHVHEIFIFVDFKKPEEAVALFNVPVDLNLGDEVFWSILTVLQFLLVEDLDGNQNRVLNRW
jgi:hypothetical protein